MYQNKFVAAVKVNGQVLREVNGSVAIPFGSEYALFLKNLNTVRVKIRVSVDGTPATGDTWLVIAPDSSCDLERFITAGNFNAGNRFKFIERTADVENHRGVKAEDGLIRIEYQTEHVRPRVDVPIPDYYPVPTPYYPPWPRHRYPRYPHYTASGGMRASLGASGGTQRSNSMSYSANNCSAGASAGLNDCGITVAGSVSNQTFYAVSDFETVGAGDAIILRLRGVLAGGKRVKTPITVKTKTICSSCGKTATKPSAFCAGCGTSLELVS